MECDFRGASMDKVSGNLAFHSWLASRILDYPACSYTQQRRIFLLTRACSREGT